MPRTRSRPRPATPTRTRGLKLSIPKPKTQRRRAGRAGRHRRAGPRAGAGDPGLAVKPYQIPSESMEPTLDVGQRVLVNRFLYHFNDPQIGDIVVFHPPAGADNGTECGVQPRSRANRARSRPRTSRARTSSSGSSPGRATRSRSKTATRSSTGSRRPTSPTSSPAAAPPPAICRNRSRSHPTTTS